ncbi:uncharacterized protein [Eurosta solidaginis]|uniref:uncharacterized protein n=1 Tax=Eurosta solidaginis TaxID=178769 RepID=UPI003531256E
MTLQLQIEKLKGHENYKCWSMQVQAYLESEDLWTVLKKGPDPDCEESMRKEKRVKFIILCLIEKKILDFIIIMNKPYTASDLWCYLRRKF